MPKQAFAHVDIWVFDLDNTLYPPEARLFDQIEVKMTDFVMRELGVARPEADRLRSLYWRQHGTTLAGLMNVHGMDPEPYLEHVHDIDLDHIAPAPELAEAITALPGRKIVHTNGSRGHAARVTGQLGVDHVFDGLYGIEDAGYAPKPDKVAFDRILALIDADPARAAMFEDDVRNLRVPHEIGMRTVLAGDEDARQPHVHYVTRDLAGFLSQLV